MPAKSLAPIRCQPGKLFHPDILGSPFFKTSIILGILVKGCSPPRRVSLRRHCVADRDGRNPLARNPGVIRQPAVMRPLALPTKPAIVLSREDPKLTLRLPSR